MSFQAFRLRTGAGALALVLLAGTGAARGQASEPAAEAPGNEAPGIEIPLIGRVELPGFLAGWFGKEPAEADGAGQGGGQAGGPGGAPDPNAPPPAVIVETIRTQSVGDSFDFIGTIQPIEQVAVRARVEGYIQAVAFEGGQKIKAGDLLFQIEPAQYEASLRAAEAQLSGAQATVNQAQRDFDRQQGLAESGVTARATLDTATATLENAQASLLQAQAAVTQAQLNLSYTRIEAAIDGEISAPLITRGNYVSTASGDLATLTQMDPIWGVFPIGEGQLVTWQRIGVGETDAAPVAQNGQIGGGEGGESGGAAQAPSAGAGAQEPSAQSANASGAEPGAPAAQGSESAESNGGGTEIASAEGTGAEGAAPPPPGAETVDANARADDRDIGDDFLLKLRLPNGADYEPAGEFDFVGNTVNAATGTVEARISFPNPGGFLLANQNVTLVASEKDPPMLPVVPQAAIQLSREGRAVLLVKPDQTIERRRIQTGKVLGNMTAVTNGLQGGERVVVRGSASVKDGTKVRPVTQEEADAEASQRRGSRDNAEGGASQQTGREAGADPGSGAQDAGLGGQGGTAGSQSR